VHRAAVLLYITASAVHVASHGQGAPPPIRSLSPSAFTEAPSSIRRELVNRGCSIPQPFGSTRRANLIRGDFYGDGHVSWAALCSRNQSSSILVFRNPETVEVAELGRRPDTDYLQEVEPGRAGFSRQITVASPRFILERYRASGGPKPPNLSHSGINDAFLDKASVVWFWQRGRWLRLTGAN
jgi:hypothetical protein